MGNKTFNWVMFVVLIAASSCGEKKDTVSAKIMEIVNSGNGELVVLDKKKRGSLEKQPKKAWLVKQ